MFQGATMRALTVIRQIVRVFSISSHYLRLGIEFLKSNYGRLIGMPIESHVDTCDALVSRTILGTSLTIAPILNGLLIMKPWML